MITWYVLYKPIFNEFLYRTVYIALLTSRRRVHARTRVRSQGAAAQANGHIRPHTLCGEWRLNKTNSGKRERVAYVWRRVNVSLVARKLSNDANNKTPYNSIQSTYWCFACDARIVHNIIYCTQLILQYAYYKLLRKRRLKK